MPTCPFCSKEVPAGSSICPHCLRALPLTVTTARPVVDRSLLRTARGWLRPTVFALALLAVGGYGLREYQRERAKPEPVLLPEGEVALPTGPVTTTIAPPIDVRIADTTAVPIPAGGHLSYTFSGGGRAGCRVHGEVQVLPGGDRRVSVFVVDRDGLADVEAGRSPRPWYDSGPTSDVPLDVKLDGRSEYTLVVSNAADTRRAKSVRLKGVVASCAD